VEFSGRERLGLRWHAHARARARDYAGDGERCCFPHHHATARDSGKKPMTAWSGACQLSGTSGPSGVLAQKPGGCAPARSGSTQGFSTCGRISPPTRTAERPHHGNDAHGQYRHSTQPYRSNEAQQEGQAPNQQCDTEQGDMRDQWQESERKSVAQVKVEAGLGGASVSWSGRKVRSPHKRQQTAHHRDDPGDHDDNHARTRQPFPHTLPIIVGPTARSLRKLQRRMLLPGGAAFRRIRTPPMTGPGATPFRRQPHDGHGLRSPWAGRRVSTGTAFPSDLRWLALLHRPESTIDQGQLCLPRLPV
jgi:hypothetical protein